MSPAGRNKYCFSAAVIGYAQNVAVYPQLGHSGEVEFVADAKGMIESLKAQEGKRFAKVNSLLIADGEATAPTAANIRRNLSFLDQAGEGVGSRVIVRNLIVLYPRSA